MTLSATPTPSAIETSSWLCREWATERLLVLKVWPNELRSSAEREARALVALSSHGVCGDLSLSFLTELGPAVLRPYQTGSTLSVLAPQLDQESKHQLLVKIFQLLQKVHKAGWVHRDLSPANIIVESRSVTSGRVEFFAQFIDWDLAEQIRQQNTASYYPRGTAGFSLSGPDSDLLTQDLSALQKIAEFLGIKSQALQTIAVEGEGKRNKWLATLFSARP